MIKLDEIEYLIKLCIFSAFIKNERPVSAILLAPSEHGKSELLKKFSRIESVKVTSDFNTHIFEDLCVEVELGKVKTVIIPDFLRIVKRKYSTQANTFTILNAVTEEGWTGTLPLGRKVSVPIRFNVLTALTKEELLDKRHKWAKLGFLSRFLPISYSYKEETKSMIRDYIKARMYKDEGFHVFKVPEQYIDVLLAENVAEDIKNITLDIAEKENILGFRLQRQLQTLAMANALACNRAITTDEDVKIIRELSKYINFKFNEI